MTLARLLHYRDLAQKVLRGQARRKQTPRAKRASFGASKLRGGVERCILASLLAADGPVTVVSPSHRVMLWLLRDRTGYVECDPDTGRPLGFPGQEYRRILYPYPSGRATA